MLTPKRANTISNANIGLPVALLSTLMSTGLTGVLFSSAGGTSTITVIMPVPLAG